MASTNPLTSENAGQSGGAGTARSYGPGKAQPFGKSKSATPLVLDRVPAQLVHPAALRTVKLVIFDAHEAIEAAAANVETNAASRS